MADFEMALVPVLKDNYVYLVRDGETGAVGVVDPSVGPPVIEALESRGWRPSIILNTHHHPDHIGGNAEIKERYGCPIAAPAADRHRIDGVDEPLSEGGRVRIGAAEGQVLEVPGHTSGHIAVHFAGQKTLFCGDTLFSLGCGRLFEGTPEQMWDSLKKLRALPEDTAVCCGHEYTEANGRFALTVEPDNEALQRRMREVTSLRAKSEPTVPSRLGAECQANPFLRADAAGLRRALGMEDAGDVEVFAEVRRRKDNF